MNKYDVIIVGGGPAGLAAGIYASRAALKTILFEKGMPGGLVAGTDFIENYPGFAEGIGGVELTMQMDAQARRFGLEYKSSAVTAISPESGYFIIQTDDGDYQAKSVIIATGAQSQSLGVAGEKEFHGRGVSYCATCDGAFFKDKAVAVVGGGDAAVEEALYLTKFADQVHIIHRRGELRATKILQERAKNNPKIIFHWHSVVDQIVGQSLVEGVKIKNVTTGQVELLNVQGIFIYIGTVPVSDLVQDLVQLDQRNYIITDEEMRTSTPGLFAAGDIRQKSLRQVVTAVADGAIAAVSAEKYIENGSN